MADIVLNVEVRAGSGSGSARAARREGLVPGVLYGGDKDPVSIAVRANEFRKALYSGKLLGHLVKLAHGGETQSVIAKDVQFHPVSDEPLHFDLYRVSEHQLVKIAVPVHFKNQETSPGLKRGGTLNVAVHEVQLLAPADHIPEDIVVDLEGLDIGDSVKSEDLKLPEGVQLAPHDAHVTIASIATSSAMQSEEGESAAAAEGDAEA
jgi:large subunit ribosomal protein L25